MALLMLAGAKEADPPDELLDNLDFFLDYEVAQDLDGLEAEGEDEEAEVDISTDAVHVSSGTKGSKP